MHRKHDRLGWPSGMDGWMHATPGIGRRHVPTLGRLHPIQAMGVGSVGVLRLGGGRRRFVVVVVMGVVLNNLGSRLQVASEQRRSRSDGEGMCGEIQGG